MPDRREFLHTLALAAAACAAPRGNNASADSAGAGASIGAAAGAGAAPGAAGAPAAGSGQLDRIGIQLYAVRKAMEGNVDRTLARLAEIGYTEVEPAGYHGRTPAEFRRALDANGLTAPAAHIPVGDVRDKTSATIDAARALGARWVVVPWLAPNERTADDYRRVADVLNRAGEAARAAGMRVAYHNHDFELVPVGGTRPLDLLLERTDPNLVDFELDLYWAVKAGADPLAYFSRWPGRFPLVHVKDSAGPPEHRQTDVGAGTINFAQLFAQRGQAGTRHFFVEHDDPADPLAFAAASFRALRALRF